ncbi:uncharacterized protein LOC107621161 isoform X2 [Arachis ipaensis]|uniref:uncharacterized protein LOC107621161 isoform X2 n=1 Tax=Arachis ipaensis TaxID=130454 RepID=UPI000A2B269F|nr:uncharacterized protein LOC107621161 isoform X2 [Arachis ipaensis]QHN83283.1 uncharacterized protein DS421_20g703410 [Arachis hypogaea]
MCYMHGKVKRFPSLDLDYVNFFDLVTLFKELGYTRYKEIFWLDMRTPNMEAGLHAIKEDMENQMRENKLMNRDIDELHIYFEHEVDMAEVIEDGVALGTVVVSSSSSSSDDGYETTEDEPYKPPLSRYETDDSSSDEGIRAKKKKRRPKKSLSGKRQVDEEATGYETDDKDSDEELRNTDGEGRKGG